jgi:hypothetical protein
MRSTLHNLVAALLPLLVAGCGNLENAPFRVGTVRGQLTEYDPAVALVSVVGEPGVLANVDAQGRFTLEAVPAGPVELFIVATMDKAARLPVKVPGGQSVDVMSVKPGAAGFFDLRVKASQRQRVTAGQATVEGTPFQQLLLDDEGGLRVGPLPDGCYAVTVTATGFPEARAEACVGAGEKKELKVELNGDSDGRGCAVTGCEDGLVCAPNGRCVECADDSQCGEGMACKGFRCEGPGAQCAACDGDWKCQPGASCQEVSGSGAVCVARCGSSADCDAGFTCQDSQCLPDAARFASCQALRQLNMPCDGDAACRGLGLADGLCVDGACTMRCDSDRECPGSLRCLDSAAGRVCRSRR